MENLIVYYSFTHNNEKLATYLSNKQECEKIKIETIKARNGFSILLDLMFSRRPKLKSIKQCLAEYDHVIFISPIWAGRIATPLASFLRKERSMIGRYSFISLCGGSPEQKEKIDRELISLMGKKPQSHVELSLNDLLPVQQKNTIKQTTSYRVEPRELDSFEPQLREFMREHASPAVNA